MNLNRYRKKHWQGTFGEYLDTPGGNHIALQTIEIAAVWADMEGRYGISGRNIQDKICTFLTSAREDRMCVGTFLPNKKITALFSP